MLNYNSLSFFLFENDRLFFHCFKFSFAQVYISLKAFVQKHFSLQNQEFYHLPLNHHVVLSYSPSQIFPYLIILFILNYNKIFIILFIFSLSLFNVSTFILHSKNLNSFIKNLYCILSIFKNVTTLIFDQISSKFKKNVKHRFFNLKKHYMIK